MNKRLGRLLGAGVVGIAVLSVLGPLVWVTRVATRTPEEYQSDPGGWGSSWTLQNLSDSWEVADLGDALITSASIVVPGAILATVLAALAGWGYAKHDFPGKTVAIGVTSAAMFLPIAALAMPLFEIGLSYGVVGERWFLSLVYGTIFAPWTTLFLRSYFQGVPDSITEAASLDGASAFRTFLSVGLPLSMPALATAFILNAFLQWSELLLALLLLPSGDDTTVSVAIAQFSTQFRTGGPLTAASLLIGSLPILALFLVGQRWIRSGMFTGGVKD
ncbi:MAG: carbohydrate ABC transporter permease [Ilumatobacter fluminis]|uniref:carbohydrate ABC transporter permease n=1 Tax=Ilumatobacter fluminis TaxID=467091 RepID=UPI0032EBBE4A